MDTLGNNLGDMPSSFYTRYTQCVQKELERSDDVLCGRFYSLCCLVVSLAPLSNSGKSTSSKAAPAFTELGLYNTVYMHMRGVLHARQCFCLPSDPRSQDECKMLANKHKDKQ
eukprot:2409423-Amphidinium_carterae.1